MDAANPTPRRAHRTCADCGRPWAATAWPWSKGRRLAEPRQRLPRNRHRLLYLLDRDGPVGEIPSWRTFVSDLTVALNGF